MKLTEEQKKHIHDYIEQNLCDGDTHGCMLSAEFVIDEVIEMIEEM